MTETYDELGGKPSTVQPPERVRGCGQPAHRCNHPDQHICPWLNEDRNGHVVPCGCTHEPPKGGK